MRGAILAVAAVACLLCCATGEALPQCDSLQIGQFECASPPIDPLTSSIAGCPIERVFPVECHPLEGVRCAGPSNFTVNVPCRYSTGYSFTNAISYSVMLGLVGADRFYLGYPALGLLKLLTIGWCGVGYAIDIILISLQVIGPSDGSDYAVPLNGPLRRPVSLGNATYFVELGD